jgi:hypothetical protein
LQEIAEITGKTTLALKSALHRGRARLKKVADSKDERPRPWMQVTLCCWTSQQRWALQLDADRVSETHGVRNPVIYPLEKF